MWLHMLLFIKHAFGVPLYATAAHSIVSETVLRIEFNVIAFTRDGATPKRKFIRQSILFLEHF